MKDFRREFTPHHEPMTRVLSVALCSCYVNEFVERQRVGLALRGPEKSNSSPTSTPNERTPKNFIAEFKVRQIGNFVPFH